MLTSLLSHRRRSPTQTDPDVALATPGNDGAGAQDRRLSSLGSAHTSSRAASKSSSQSSTMSTVRGVLQEGKHRVMPHEDKRLRREELKAAIPGVASAALPHGLLDELLNRAIEASGASTLGVAVPCVLRTSRTSPRSAPFSTVSAPSSQGHRYDQPLRVRHCEAGSDELQLCGTTATTRPVPMPRRGRNRYRLAELLVSRGKSRT